MMHLINRTGSTDMKTNGTTIKFTKHDHVSVTPRL